MYKHTGRAVALSLALAGALAKMLKFLLLSFYVIGKAPTGELLCTWTELGPDVQSIVSLTSSLRSRHVKCFTIL